MRKLFASAIVAVALFMGASTARADAVTPGKAPPSLGQFEVVQGEPFADLHALKGHAVQLVFFATW